MPINQSSVDQIADLLLSKGLSSWESLTTELQDDSEFVLFSIELSEAPFSGVAEGRDVVYDAIQDRIPPKPDGTYSWIAVFSFRGEVVDSVSAGAI